MYRFLRCFLCLLVVCCLILNLSPIKADAMSGGLLAPLVSGAAVTVSAPVAIAAGLIALGIMAGTNDDFQRVVSNAADSLGDWVKDGTVELIQTVDELGKKSYYMAADMMEDLRCWSFDTEVLTLTETYLFPVSETVIASYNEAISFPYSLVAFSGGGSIQTFLASNSPLSLEYKGTGVYVTFGSSGGYTYSVISESNVSKVFRAANTSWYFQSISDSGIVTEITVPSFDISAGIISSVPVDGTSAREWSEEYTNRGLYIVPGSGGSSTPPEGDDNGNNNGKWYWPVVLAGAAGAGVVTLTQEQQWTGETPQEFDDYTTKTEFEILSRPKVEFGTGIELQPVTDPEPDPGGDDGDDPGSVPDDGDDPSVTPDGGKDYSNWFAKIVGFFENIWNSILELPSKFATWFDIIISEIQELPSKFATWFENIISAIQELPSKFAEWFGNLISGLERIWESICNLPEAIGNILKSIFVPSEDFLTEKVQDLRNRFNWIEPILGYGNYIKAQLVNPEPPVLYVHLGNAEGSYNYGGTVKFLDLTWYERYKSQGDAIISGFLWALFAWRMYVKLPGIINGVAGDVGHISYGESAWQKAEGRKERKEKGGKNK